MLILNANDLVRQVKQQRKKLALSQAAIAEKIGVRQSTISAFETNPSGSKLETILKILVACGLELAIHPHGDTPTTEVWTEEW